METRYRYTTVQKVALILFLCATIGIGAGGYYIWSQQEENNTNSDSSPVQNFADGDVIFKDIDPIWQETDSYVATVDGACGEFVIGDIAPCIDYVSLITAQDGTKPQARVHVAVFAKQDSKSLKDWYTDNLQVGDPLPEENMNLTETTINGLPALAYESTQGDDIAISTSLLYVIETPSKRVVARSSVQSGLDPSANPGNTSYKQQIIDLASSIAEK